MSDKRILLTADEAASLPHDDVEYVHNTTGGMIMFGVDYAREDAIEAFKRAHRIAIGGPSCKAYRHPLVVWDTPKHCTFFEADMDKVAAFEKSREEQAHA